MPLKFNSSYKPGVALCVLTILGFTAVNSFSQSSGTSGTAEQEVQFLGATPLRGINLPVRGLDEAGITDATTRVPVEAYFDEDYGTLSYVTPSGGIASMPFPKDFHVRTAISGESVEVVRISALQGTAWRMEDGEWRLIEESDEQLSVGNYDVKIIGAEDNVVILRVDSRSGRVWFLQDDTWEVVAEVEQ